MSLVLDKVALPLKEHSHSLGVFLDLLLDKQVASVPREAFYWLHLVKQLQPFLGIKDLAHCGSCHDNI